MKLIDILVRDLPGLGGWPVGVSKIEQSSEGRLLDYSDLGKPYLFGEAVFDLTDDWNDDLGVTRKQYESALAARKTEWNGEGLPPVGYVVEFTFGPYSKERGEFSGPLPSEGQSVEVVAHKITSDGNDVAVVYWDDYGAGRASCFVSSCLKPLKTEEDKKRDEAGLALYHAINWNAEGELVSPARMEDYKKAYDAIAAGKIPGIRID